MVTSSAVAALETLKVLGSGNTTIPRRTDGSPRTIAVCVGNHQTRHECVGETKPVWQKRTFLQRWSFAIREARLVENRSSIEEAHRRFKFLVQEREETGISRAEALVQIGHSPGPLIDLVNHTADGATITP